MSVISLGTVYNTARPYSNESAGGDRAAIARYAWGDDYHSVLEGRLDRLVESLRAVAGEGLEARRYVDTGPVQERVYAQYAGLGWIGKNTCVINPQLGSWLFLSEILTTLDLAPDAPALDQCGSCALCLEACPTQAFKGPGVLDATRCISYLTIEQRGPIPDTLAPAVGSHVYGCDICQEVCPWNQLSPVSSDPAWQPRPVWRDARVSVLAATADEDLQTAMRGSAMTRTRVAGFRRNLAVAAHNVQGRRAPQPPADVAEVDDSQTQERH